MSNSLKTVIISLYTFTHFLDSDYEIVYIYGEIQIYKYQTFL